MPSESIAYRHMRPSDLQACLELKERAGWNQLRRDWELFLGFNPEGCFVACAGDRVVGSVTTIDYDGKVSWIGMVLVHPEFRRRGIGTGLLQAAIAALQHCNTIKLDATPLGKTLYDGLGFRDEYQLARMTIAALESRAGSRSDAEAQPMTTADLQEVLAFDTPIFGVNRGDVLAAWLERTPEAAVVVREQGRVVGYAMGRPGANFATIGPVVARGEAAARSLTLGVAGAFPRQPLCIDILLHTPTFRRWLERLGFEMQRPFIRMARGPNRHAGAPSKVWAALGPEVG